MKQYERKKSIALSIFLATVVLSSVFSGVNNHEETFNLPGRNNNILAKAKNSDSKIGALKINRVKIDGIQEDLDKLKEFKFEPVSYSKSISAGINSNDVLLEKVESEGYESPTLLKTTVNKKETPIKMLKTIN